MNNHSNTALIAAADHAIDDVIADSFPASDPPSWNPGVARLNPFAVQRVSRARAIEARATRESIDVIDLSVPYTQRTFIQVLTSVVGAVGVALVVPFVILLLVLPVVLAIRGLITVLVWVVGTAIL